MPRPCALTKKTTSNADVRMEQSSTHVLFSRSGRQVLLLHGDWHLLEMDVETDKQSDSPFPSSNPGGNRRRATSMGRRSISGSERMPADVTQLLGRIELALAQVRVQVCRVQVCRVRAWASVLSRGGLGSLAKKFGLNRIYVVCQISCQAVEGLSPSRHIRTAVSATSAQGQPRLNVSVWSPTVDVRTFRSGSITLGKRIRSMNDEAQRKIGPLEETRRRKDLSCVAQVVEGR